MFLKPKLDVVSNDVLNKKYKSIWAQSLVQVFVSCINAELGEMLNQKLIEDIKFSFNMCLADINYKDWNIDECKEYFVELIRPQLEQLYTDHLVNDLERAFIGSLISATKQ